MSLLDELARLPAAALLAALATSSAPDPAVARLPGGDTAGPAVTCRCPPADNLTVIHAIEACEPGDVLVVETDASVEVALFGGLLATWAVEKGSPE